MVGTAAPGKLISFAKPASDRIRYEVASHEHDDEIRRLLRDNPMPGRISISLEREPHYFAASEIEGLEHKTVVALDGNRVIAVGSISCRTRFINSNATRVGYLGGLRLDQSFRGRADVILKGYRFFEQLHEQGGPPIYLTSIISENLRARRLLERGLKGMPTYRYVGDLVTLMIPTRRRIRTRIESPLPFGVSSPEDRADIAELLSRS